jgi:hypothetical protein
MHRLRLKNGGYVLVAKVMRVEANDFLCEYPEGSVGSVDGVAGCDSPVLVFPDGSCRVVKEIVGSGNLHGSSFEPNSGMEALSRGIPIAIRAIVDDEGTVREFPGVVKIFR